MLVVGVGIGCSDVVVGGSVGASVVRLRVLLVSDAVDVIPSGKGKLIEVDSPCVGVWLTGEVIWLVEVLNDITVVDKVLWLIGEAGNVVAVVDRVAWLAVELIEKLMDDLIEKLMDDLIEKLIEKLIDELIDELIEVVIPVRDRVAWLVREAGSVPIDKVVWVVKEAGSVPVGKVLSLLKEAGSVPVES